jgi:S-adenosylmethionine decarboxylase
LGFSFGSWPIYWLTLTKYFAETQRGFWQKGWIMQKVKPATHKPEVGFGLHLTLDGYGGSYERLTDLDLIYQFLETCPDMIHMTKIMPPHVFKYHGKVPEDWGVSGFVIIAESHISIHTFPEHGYLSLDVFSCKDFEYKQAVDYVTELFGLSHYEINLLDRGLEFPRNATVVEHILRQEREQMRG